MSISDPGWHSHPQLQGVSARQPSCSPPHTHTLSQHRAPAPFYVTVCVCLAAGKAYEITYVRVKFRTSRPESFAIYKRTRTGGPWEPYQYYSASCWKTYGRPEGQYLRPGEDERVAFCTSEFSDISPLNGGNVAFSTLEGRPSAYNFEESPVLQVRGQQGLGDHGGGGDGASLGWGGQ